MVYFGELQDGFYEVFSLMVLELVCGKNIWTSAGTS
jgi:hypothetical protein